MHADYSNANNASEYSNAWSAIKNRMPNVEAIWPAETPDQAYATAIQLAKRHTGRAKIIILTDPLDVAENRAKITDSNVAIIAADNSALLCETIALSTERIAAIIVKHHSALAYYYKKVRELSSAEGAIMIWDELTAAISKTDQSIKIFNNSQPDIICFNFTDKVNSFWLGGRADIIKLI